MDFIEYVAIEMFKDKAVPSNVHGVRTYMEHLVNRLRVQNMDELLRTNDSYLLELQGRIELDRHIQLYGKFEN
jgi:hypothetical protein